jgi:hypothetical protein
MTSVLAPESAPLRLSANQWRTTIHKVCVGAGIARGNAEDVAEAGLALLGLQINPLDCLFYCLDQDRQSSSDLRWSHADESVKLMKVQVLHHGPSIVDLAQCGMVAACQIDDLMLLAGLARARFHSHGARFQISTDGHTWRNLAPVIVDPGPRRRNMPVWLRLDAITDLQRPDLSNLISPSWDDWRRLLKLADKILVPADAANRADAGAGTTDND